MLKKISFIIPFLVYHSILLSQKQATILHFKNSSTQKGFASIIKEKTIVKFSSEKNGKKLFFNHKDLIGVSIYNGGSLTKYKYLLENTKGFHFLLFEVLQEGNVNLYRLSNESKNSKKFKFGLDITNDDYERYYVCKKDENMVTQIASTGTRIHGDFKKNAMEYLK